MNLNDYLERRRKIAKVKEAIRISFGGKTPRNARFGSFKINGEPIPAFTTDAQGRITLTDDEGTVGA